MDTVTTKPISRWRSGGSLRGPAMLSNNKSVIIYVIEPRCKEDTCKLTRVTVQSVAVLLLCWNRGCCCTPDFVFASLHPQFGTQQKLSQWIILALGLLFFDIVEKNLKIKNKQIYVCTRDGNVSHQVSVVQTAVKSLFIVSTDGETGDWPIEKNRKA